MNKHKGDKRIWIWSNRSVLISTVVVVSTWLSVVIISTLLYVTCDRQFSYYLSLSQSHFSRLVLWFFGNIPFCPLSFFCAAMGGCFFFTFCWCCVLTFWERGCCYQGQPFFFTFVWCYVLLFWDWGLPFFLTLGWCYVLLCWAIIQLTWIGNRFVWIRIVIFSEW